MVEGGTGGAVVGEDEAVGAAEEVAGETAEPGGRVGGGEGGQGGCYGVRTAAEGGLWFCFVFNAGKIFSVELLRIILPPPNPHLSCPAVSHS